MAKKFRLTAPKEFVPKEYDDQVTVFEWAKLCKLDGIEWLFATLNGVRLSIGAARKAKRAGMKAGVPDMVLPVRRGGYSGFFCELKREKGGIVSQAQVDWHDRLRQEGFKVVVTYGAHETIEAIKAYLDQA